MTTEPGLRERKKAATRAAMGKAALKLALEHGPDHVTAEAIAAEAGVSPRTFHNYFPSKDDAIMSSLLDQAHRLKEELKVRPADEPVWDSIRAAFLNLLDMSPDDLAAFAEQMDMIRSSPALALRHVVVFEAMGWEIVETIGERVGVDAKVDMYPRLLASAAGIAVKTALEIWLADREGPPIAERFDAALDLVRRGLPEPGR